MLTTIKRTVALGLALGALIGQARAQGPIPCNPDHLWPEGCEPPVACKGDVEAGYCAGFKGCETNYHGCLIWFPSSYCLQSLYDCHAANVGTYRQLAEACCAMSRQQMWTDAYEARFGEVLSQGGMGPPKPPVAFLPPQFPPTIGSMTSHGGSIGIVTMTIHSGIERRPYRGPWDSAPPTVLERIRWR